MRTSCFFVEKLLRVMKQGAEDTIVDNLSEPDSCNYLSHRSYFVDVPHVRQLFNWDCGLACVLMVLRTLGIGDCNVEGLEKLCSTNSIWTVDLAYLLHKFSVSFYFFTVTIGANPGYAEETFYKEQLQSDVERVDGLFQKALEAGISIQCRSISAKDISVLILSGDYIAVALVDKIKLRVVASDATKNIIFDNRSWLNSICVSDYDGDNSCYIGHFVIICGYDAETQEFEIRDPASSRKHERVSLECLEAARKSFGTDEDIILVALNKDDTKSPPLQH